MFQARVVDLGAAKGAPEMAGAGIQWFLGIGRLVEFCACVCGRAVGACPSSGRGDWAVRASGGQEPADHNRGGIERRDGGVAQTYRLLASHGAESTLPSFLAVAMVVELGPLLAGLLVAGRMGAGLAAELGFDGAE